MSSSKPVWLNKDNIKKFLDSFDTILTDCDGVLWSGDDVIGKSNVVLNKLRSFGKKVFYVTNNSTKSRSDYVEKCTKLGFQANLEEMVSTSYITAQYMKDIKFNKKAYIVGTKGIAEELKNVGIDSFGFGPDVVPDSLLDLKNTTSLDPEVGAVIVGFDHHFSYSKMMKAGSYLSKPDCLFIATNTDEVFPVNKPNIVFPGTGAFVRAIETVSGREANVMGKPFPRMFETLKDKHQLNPSRTLMIGDRCNTDILLGKNCNLFTLVVLSGVTSLTDIEKWQQSSSESDQRLLADYILNSLTDLLELI